MDRGKNILFLKGNKRWDKAAVVCEPVPGGGCCYQETEGWKEPPLPGTISWEVDRDTVSQETGGETWRRLLPGKLQLAWETLDGIEPLLPGKFNSREG